MQPWKALFDILCIKQTILSKYSNSFVIFVSKDKQAIKGYRKTLNKINIKSTLVAVNDYVVIYLYDYWLLYKTI